MLLKEGAFEPSNPTRHMTELASIIETETHSKAILFLYTDGGPDHRLTYLSVQLLVIALFHALDLDYLCAARTAPYHLWRNPVERIMPRLNLGLQCVGLSRRETTELHVSKASSLKQIHEIAEKHPEFKEAVSDSISNVKFV